MRLWRLSRSLNELLSFVEDESLLNVIRVVRYYRSLGV